MRHPLVHRWDADREHQRHRRTLAGLILVVSRRASVKDRGGEAKKEEAEGLRMRSDCSGFVEGPPLFVLVQKRRR